MPCKEILYYDADTCGTNFAGISSRIMIVPLSTHEGVGLKNMNVIRDWSADNFSYKPAVGASFTSLRLPSIKEGEEEAEICKLLGAVPVEINPLKSSFKSTSSGPLRGKMYSNELKITLLSRSVDDIDFLTSIQLANRYGIIFKDANGNFRFMADEDNLIDSDTDDDSGEGPTAEAAAVITFKQVSKHQPFFYFGLVHYGPSYKEEDAAYILDCKTGIDTLIDNSSNIE